MTEVRRFGSYYLLKKIATGGMAELYKARKSGEKGFEKLLAIKTILPHLASNEEFASMFIDEAKVASVLEHQNIVQIYDLGRIEDTYCIVMEYVRGRDLKHVLYRAKKANKPLSLDHVCTIASSILSGLSYAHRKKDKGVELGIVHRDISPPNIIVSYEGAVKIVDFGIAKVATRSQDTKVGIVKGKVSYMSPEQAHGERLDQRSDVFSVGSVMYEMLTGAKLFDGENDMEVMKKVWAAKVEPLPSELNPGVPKLLEKIIIKSLARERDMRFQSAADMHHALQQFMHEAGYTGGAEALSTQMQSMFRYEIDKEVQEEDEWDRAIASQNGHGHASETTGAALPGNAADGTLGTVRGSKQVLVPSGQEPADKPDGAAKTGLPFKVKVMTGLALVSAIALAVLFYTGTHAGSKGEPAPAKPKAVVPDAPHAAVPAPAKDTPAAPTAKSDKAPSTQPRAKEASAVKATASITSEPSGVPAYVDGRPAGNTPLRLADVKPAGRHRVRLVKDGYEDWDGSFSATPGTPGKVHAVLRKKAAPSDSSGNSDMWKDPFPKAPKKK